MVLKDCDLGSYVLIPCKCYGFNGVFNTEISWPDNRREHLTAWGVFRVSRYNGGSVRYKVTLTPVGKFERLMFPEHRYADSLERELKCFCESKLSEQDCPTFFDKDSLETAFQCADMLNLRKFKDIHGTDTFDFLNKHLEFYAE